MVKIASLGLAGAFLIFYIVSSPDQAANIATGTGDLVSNIAHGVGHFIDKLAS